MQPRALWCLEDLSLLKQHHRMAISQSSACVIRINNAIFIHFNAPSLGKQFGFTAKLSRRYQDLRSPVPTQAHCLL